MLAQVIIFAIVFIASIIALGLLIAAEKSIVAIRSFRIKELISRGDKRAEMVKQIRSDPDRFFASIKIISVIIISAVSFFTGLAGFNLMRNWIQIAFVLHYSVYLEMVAAALLIIITALVIVISGGVFSRIITPGNQESFALFMSKSMWSIQVTLKPLIVTFNWLSGILLALLGVRGQVARDDLLSESEIKMVLREGYLEGSSSDYERKIIHAMMEFAGTDVRRAMTPRTDIVAFDINAPVEDILKIAIEDKFSRFPVYEENIDNIRGIIHSRDLLYVFTNRELFTLSDIIRTAYFVPDSKPIVELLREMQLNKTHMAVVLDEFGGTGGLITLEDILEEIVGDIQDEYDQEESKIVFINPDKARVLASMPIDEFADEFNVEVEEGEFDTVGGMLATMVGKIPAKGDVYDFKGFSLEVWKKDGHRIQTLIARKITGDSKSV